MQYPPNIHPVRVMCSGTVDPVYLIKALLSGADAVMVGGCHPGDCHYVSGNYKARRKIAMLKAIFKALGLEKRYLHDVQKAIHKQKRSKNPTDRAVGKIELLSRSRAVTLVEDLDSPNAIRLAAIHRRNQQRPPDKDKTG